MLFPLIVALCSLAAGGCGGGSRLLPWRQPSLDGLAAGILSARTIPESPGLLVMAASCGWPGSIELVSTGSLEELEAQLEASPEGTCWGSSGDDSLVVLVTAPFPDVVPEGLDLVIPRHGSASFSLLPAGGCDRVLASYPSGEVVELVPDSAGVLHFQAREQGLSWIEAVRDGPEGPEVVLLLPVCAGISASRALETGLAPGMDTLEDILSDIGERRGRRHLQPLVRTDPLDSLALARAREVAESGVVSHAGLLRREAPVDGLTRAENIARGGSLAEAHAMIMASPIHLAACLDPEYGQVGIGSAVQIGRYGWQIVVVEIFLGAAHDRCP
jgi:uncharacterized protein YkwD